MILKQIDNPFEEQNITEVYDRHNHKYHNYKEALKHFGKLVPLENKILEIGVGTGTFTKLLLARGYDVHGIDRSKEMLKKPPNRFKFYLRMLTY